MIFKDGIGQCLLRLALAVALLNCHTIISVGIGFGSNTQWDKGEENTAIQNNSAQIKNSGSNKDKQGAEKGKPQNDPDAGKDENNESPELPNEKNRQALSLLEGVLIASHRITPVEYRILTEVEAATVIWNFDKERAITMLRSTVITMRDLLDEKKQTTAREFRQTREQRLWFLAFRKIAALKPELVQELLRANASGGKTDEPIKREWTEEARALRIAAEEQIEKDPKAAARIAEQIFPLGMIDWPSFLAALNKRDAGEAQRLARIYIDRVRNSSITLIELGNFQRFVFMPEIPPSLQDYYFQAVVIRLRRELRPDVSSRELEAALSTAQTMSRFAARHSSQWQQEFDNLAFAFEAAFKERSWPLPGPPVKRVIDMSAVSPATPGDSQEVKDTLAKVAAITNTYSRDIEYQKLAIKAAARADTGLAEEITSKINDDDLRRFVSAQIYSPLVKKAISESDWTLSQNLAAKIPEPLARALAFDSIALAMLQEKAEKQSVIDLYTGALARLYNEFTTERVVKANLLLAKALYRVDQERGLEAIKSFVYVQNKLTLKSGPIEESPLESSLTVWVRYTNYALSADEIMNLPDMVTSAFEDLARRNVDAALSVSMSLRDQGMYSFAQLAIAKVLLEEARKAQPSARVKRAAKE